VLLLDELDVSPLGKLLLLPFAELLPLLGELVLPLFDELVVSPLSKLLLLPFDALLPPLDG
jgi:hypothetical protein